jgi:hypothetical protein
MSIAKTATLIQSWRAASKERSLFRAPNTMAFLPILLSCLLFWPFGGGSKKVDLMAGNTTPGAHGTVSVKVGSNKNTELDLKVYALAQPSSLTPAENVYVVWVQPPGENPKNEGQLSVDKNENGELHTEVPYKRFKVFVTAEQVPQTPAPTGPQVLSADVQQH